MTIAAQRRTVVRPPRARGRLGRVGGTAGTEPPDLVLIAASAALLAIGALLVWSATSSGYGPGRATGFLRRDLVNIAIGIALGAGAAATDRRWVRILTPVLYLGAIAGLVLVLVMGSTINGSRSWLLLGGLSVQPAEFAKLAVVLGMALWVAERRETAASGRIGPVDVLGMLVIASVPLGLIALQPDLGTMLVLAGSVLGVLAVAGAPLRWLVGLGAAGLAAATVAIGAGLLKGYQIDRFLAFTDPGLDPRGAGYNTVQARIAIGNGGLFGQGLFHGSQTQSGFVPEQHTDFVFTVAGEELGLLGAGLLVLLYAVLLWRAIRISWEAPDLFGRIGAGGIACWFGFQGFWNIGMCLGIMPVTGVPLPLVSYGGSSMFASLMAVGLLVNISTRPRRFRAG